MLQFELVLPAYNEEKNLPGLIERAVAAAEQHGHRADTFQLVVVENGSQDGSSRLLDELQEGSPLSPWFRVVKVPQNRGYGFGLWQGLQSTTAPYVGWSHADLQCDPNDAFRALQLASRESGRRLLVKGTRYGRGGKDRFVSRVFELLALLVLGLRVNEINAQPKVCGRELLTWMKHPPATFAFDLYALYQSQKQGYQIETVAVEFPPRIHGTSKWASTFVGRYRTILGMIAYMFGLARREGRL